MILNVKILLGNAVLMKEYVDILAKVVAVKPTRIAHQRNIVVMVNAKMRITNVWIVKEMIAIAQQIMYVVKYKML